MASSAGLVTAACGVAIPHRPPALVNSPSTGLSQQACVGPGRGALAAEDSCLLSAVEATGNPLDGDPQPGCWYAPRLMPSTGPRQQACATPARLFSWRAGGEVVPFGALGAGWLTTNGNQRQRALRSTLKNISGVLRCRAGRRRRGRVPVRSVATPAPSPARLRRWLRHRARARRGAAGRVQHLFNADNRGGAVASPRASSACRTCANSQDSGVGDSGDTTAR